MSIELIHKQVETGVAVAQDAPIREMADALTDLNPGEASTELGLLIDIVRDMAAKATSVLELASKVDTAGWDADTLIYRTVAGSTSPAAQALADDARAIHGDVETFANRFGNHATQLLGHLAMAKDYLSYMSVDYEDADRTVQRMVAAQAAMPEHAQQFYNEIQVTP
jgi:hypothetical protein